MPNAPEHFISRARPFIPAEAPESLRHVAPPKSRDIFPERFPAVQEIHLAPDVRDALGRRRSGQLDDAAPLEVGDGTETRRPRVFDRARLVHDKQRIFRISRQCLEVCARNAAAVLALFGESVAPDAVNFRGRCGLRFALRRSAAKHDDAKVFRVVPKRRFLRPCAIGDGSRCDNDGPANESEAKHLSDCV